MVNIVYNVFSRNFAGFVTLPDRLKVGQETLDLFILVRFQVRQPKNRIAVFAKIRSVKQRRDLSFSQNSPRVFEIQRERAGREAGVRANLFKKISFGFEIFFVIQKQMS